MVTTRSENVEADSWISTKYCVAMAPFLHVLGEAAAEFQSLVFQSHHFEPSSSSRGRIVDALDESKVQSRRAGAETIPAKYISLKTAGCCGFFDDNREKCASDVCAERMRLAEMEADAEMDETGASQVC